MRKQTFGVEILVHATSTAQEKIYFILLCLRQCIKLLLTVALAQLGM
jgi:hypothetical protein